MKHIKIVSSLMAAAVMSSMLCFPVSAANVRLTKTSVTLNEGDTSKVSLNGATGKVKWTVSDASVFKYSKGTVTAVSEGSAYLYATNNGKKYKCLVTVKSTSDDDHSIQIGSTLKITVPLYNENIYVKNSSPDICSVSCKEKSSGYEISVKANLAGTSVITLSDPDTDAVYKKITVNISSSSTSSSDDEDIDCSDSSFTEKVVELVNEQRAAAGVEEVETADFLMDGAAIRVKEIGEKYSHTRPDGTKCFTVLDVKGSLGENLGRGYSSPEAVMKAWMNSSGHKKNILSPKFKYIGVGYDSETKCWVQIFYG